MNRREVQTRENGHLPSELTNHIEIIQKEAGCLIFNPSLDYATLAIYLCRHPRHQADQQYFVKESYSEFNKLWKSCDCA